MNSKLALSVMLALTITFAYSKKSTQDSTYKKFFIGSSPFMLANLNTEQSNPPDFYQSR